MKQIFTLCFFMLLVANTAIYSECLTADGIGTFEGTTPLEFWYNATEGNASFQIETVDVYAGSQSLKVDVTTPSSWQVRMFNKPTCYFDMELGETYTVSFAAKGNVGANLSVFLMKHTTNDVTENIVLDSNDWKTYQIDMTPTLSTDSARLKINFTDVGAYYIDNISVKKKPTNWYVSPSGTNNLNGDNGQSTAAPFKTIQYAIGNAWQAGDTIFVMNGTYRNTNYGTGSLNNNAVVSLSNPNIVGQEDGWLIIRNYPGHQPKIQFDGAGGFVGSGQSYLEISGFEIEGPNQNINYTEAFANRLIQDNYYSGRGITIWSGHHINIHDNLIHDCPNSGIRVNNGDYCDISNNEVYNNTWWSSNAESAIVFATSLDIDTKDTIKMVITKNLVYDNYNNVPYYNSTYTGEDSDYGTAAQDYIIDGSGCYITRNKDTYFYGWFYFANNICYGNGINGLVVHKSDRAIVSNNTCYMNGAVPLSSGRQASSGITINASSYVKMFNNISWPRFETDSGYKIYNAASSQFLEASNNILANGLSDFTAAQYTFADPQFIDTANFDLRLQETSPAVDAGIVHIDLPLDDFSDNLRDATPDIGAYEFICTTGAACDDNDICTINDVFDENCNCVGTFQDTDNDGVCDAEDICPDGDDNIDENGNGIPDFCDVAECTYSVGNFNNFNSKWKLWQDGGSDCRRSANDAPYSSGGVGRSVRLRDNTNSSIMTTKNMNLTNYEELTINFTYYTRSMDNSNEDFWFQISLDGGATFTTLEEWNQGDEFENDQRYYDQVVVMGPFTANTKLRFRCDASANNDVVYIDDVEINVCTSANNNLSASPFMTQNANAKNKTQAVQQSLDEENSIIVYPNPFSENINIELKDMGENKTAIIEIFDMNGSSLKKESFYNQKNIQLNDLNLQVGQYILRIIVGEKVKIQKIIKF
ncbi:MAG: T9SS type A sorting domain-containing protein [Chitinophagales bacterium]